MQVTTPKGQQQPATARLVTDTVIAPMIGVSVGFLQRDRREGKRIPYIKLGDRVLYDPDAVMEAVRALTIGGPRGRRSRRERIADEVFGAGSDE